MKIHPTIITHYTVHNERDALTLYYKFTVSIESYEVLTH